jgi:hypothetical protein
MKVTLFALVAALLLSAGIVQNAQSADVSAMEGVKLAGYVRQKDIPGLGTVYADPRALPNGPFLGYDPRGQLTSVTYLIPLAGLEKHENYHDLGRGLSGFTVDHTDILFKSAGGGMDEPHYQIVEWVATGEPVVASKTPAK